MNRRKPLPVMLVIGIAILICGTGVAGAAVLEEGFETSVPPAGWTETMLIDAGTGTPDWTRESSGGSPSCSPPEGSYMAKFNSYSCGSGSQASLNTSEMDFTGLTDVELKFWMYHDTGYGSSYTEKITVRGSIDNSTWVDITTIDRWDGSDEWKEHTVDLSDYGGNASVWISFVGISDYGSNMYIDKVEIGVPPPKTLSSLSVNQANTSHVHPGSNNSTILRLDFNVTGSAGTLPLNSIEVEPQNTNNGDVTWVKLYRTTTTTFSTDNQLGTAQNFSSAANFSGLSYNLPTGMTYVWITYDIASGAACGNTFDAKILAGKVNVNDSTYPATDQDPAGSRQIVCKSLESLTGVQASTASVYQDSVNNTILRLDFNVTGVSNTLNLTEIKVTSQNDDDNDIAANGVKAYYTATTTFSTTNRFGAGASFASGVATISGSYDLPPGMTYVWITYDVTSTVGNIVDARINANDVTVAGSTHPAVAIDPAGSRPIRNPPVHNTDTGENFSAIQAAIDDADTLAWHTITIDAGTYTENVDVNKQLTIRSVDGYAVTTVEANVTNDHVFEVTQDYVNISGFTVKGATDAGYAGIYLSGTDHCNISDNKATDNENGMYLNDDSDYNTLANNNASGNNRQGIYLDYADYNDLTNNTASSNEWSEGIYLWYSHYNNLTENTANSNNQDDGIDLSYSNHNNLTDNTANVNGDEGIRLYYSDYNNVTDNTANSNYDRGFYLDHADYNNLTDNTACSSTNSDGIRLKTSTYNELTRNTANSNDDNGIYLESSSTHNELARNTANLNGQHGIWLNGYYSQCGYSNVTNNTANSNTDTGIKLSYYSSYCNVMNNTAKVNKYGIYLYGYSSKIPEHNNITGNTVLNNTDYGIYLNKAQDNEILCNWVAHNEQRGFYLKSTSTGNNISLNNILVNGDVQADGSYHWNFYNDQSDAVTAKNNWWGTTNGTVIDESIYDDEEGKGAVDFSGYKSGSVPCAPIPELATIVLFGVGLIALVGYVGYGRKEEE